MFYILLFGDDTQELLGPLEPLRSKYSYSVSISFQFSALYCGCDKTVQIPHIVHLT